MKKIYTVVAVLLVFCAVGKAQEITFSKDIAPIIYDNCTVCHRPNEIGPMSFTSYDEVRNWGPMIQYVTEIKYMPPWKPDPHYSRFLDERGLSEGEVAMIKQWVENGMPQGNLADEPPVPTFPEGSQIGEPDLVLSFAESYTHKGNNRDQYQIFVLPTGLTEDRVIKSIELRPGNRRIVHHALFTMDATGQARQKDAATPEYGYPGFGGFGVPEQGSYPGYVPGSKARLLPESMGLEIKAGSDLLIQMHYAPSPVDEVDSTTVNIFFADEEEQVERFVEEAILLPFFPFIQNGPFVMQPESVKEFYCTFTTPIDVSLIAVAPHMHLLGKDWTVFAVDPQGDTTNIISIPDWDFNWQGAYFFPRLIPVKAGTTLHAYATYDNTSDNPFNPTFPPRRVSWGEGTEDEMFYLPFFYVPYQQGDENIVFEELTTSSDDLDFDFPKNILSTPYPNPCSDKAMLEYQLETRGNYTIDVFDIQGRLVKQPMLGQYHSTGTHQFVINTSGLENGTYLVRLSTQGMELSQKLTVLK
ncbi:MAG: T9SS type A sorting domain-containing protein [Bacteroidota bacterium]